MFNERVDDMKIMRWPLAERFVSINGEGQKAGRLAAFLRFKGCNLSCSYCDTAWANEEDCPCSNQSIEEILLWLRQQKAACVTLTGGEPLIQPGIDRLIQAIQEEGYELEIETNGSVDLTPFASLSPRPAFTLDYKCPDSGMESLMITDHYSLLQKKDTVKFVTGSILDLDRAFSICKEYDLGSRCSVFLSAVFGKISPREIAEYMIRHHWKEARLQLQIHKYIWPPEERGV